MDPISRRTFGLALGAAAVGGPLQALASAEPMAEATAQDKPPVGRPDELCDLSAVDLVWPHGAFGG